MVFDCHFQYRQAVQIDSLVNVGRRLAAKGIQNSRIPRDPTAWDTSNQAHELPCRCPRMGTPGPRQSGAGVIIFLLGTPSDGNRMQFFFDVHQQALHQGSIRPYGAPHFDIGSAASQVEVPRCCWKPLPAALFGARLDWSAETSRDGRQSRKAIH